MIQRKQTLFMLVAVILGVVCLSLPIASIVPHGMSVPEEVYNLWVVQANGGHDLTTWPLFASLLLTLPIAVVAIFSYNKRQLQARLCVINILLLIFWYIFFAVFSLRQQDKLQLTVSAALPAVSIILYYMARHGVISDEKLVRSMDRIR